MKNKNILITGSEGLLGKSFVKYIKSKCKNVFCIDIKNIKSVLLSLSLAILACYFIYHTIYGSKGFFTLAKLSNELEQKKEKLAIITKEKSLLENKVNSFSDKNIDLDLLDQQARRILGYASPEETILIITSKNKKAE